MKKVLGFFLLSSLILSACSNSSGLSDAAPVLPAKATLSVSGSLNEVKTYSSGDKKTQVACIQDPGINFSEITLQTKSDERTLSDNSNLLDQFELIFQSKEIPSGHIGIGSQTTGASMRYIIQSKSGAGTSNTFGPSSSNCDLDITRNSNKLSMDISCPQLANSAGDQISIKAHVECSIFQMN